jgi:hypothetical protein
VFTLALMSEPTVAAREPRIPRLGGRLPLPPGPAAIAAGGTWSAGHYACRSEARMAVLVSAAARGWRLAEVRDEINSGRWIGLADLYGKPREPDHIDRLLTAEWRIAVPVAADAYLRQDGTLRPVRLPLIASR